MKKLRHTNAPGWAILLLTMICVMVSLSGLSSAVPPVTTTQNFANGYTFKIPQDNILKQGQDYNFEFHIFNISNGLPITSGVSCYFHLYDFTGSNVYTATQTATSGTQFDYGFFINGTNFTQVGSYYYDVQCNSSTLGGYDSTIVWVTPSGISQTSANGVVIIFFSALFIILLMIVTYLIIYSLAHAFNLDFDIKDLATNYGIYFGVVGLYLLSNIYLSNQSMATFILWFIKVGIVTNIVLPTIYFILTLTIGSWMEQRVKGVDY